MLIMLLLGCLSWGGLCKNDRSAILALARLLLADRYYRSTLLASSGRQSDCPSVTTVSCGQTARWIELIFGTDLPLPKRHHTYFGGIRAPKVLGSMGRYRKIQAIVKKFCTATIYGKRNMSAKCQLNRPK